MQQHYGCACFVFTSTFNILQLTDTLAKIGKFVIIFLVCNLYTNRMISEIYISKMHTFWENNKLLLAVNYFHKKASS